MTTPTDSWLIANGLPHETSLDLDLSGDSVPLRMAYALNLDPRADLSKSLPVPAFHHDTLFPTVPAITPRITYRVETSTDLEIWTSEGVPTTALGGGRRRASIPRDQARSAFLRLVILESSGP